MPVPLEVMVENAPPRAIAPAIRDTAAVEALAVEEAVFPRTRAAAVEGVPPTRAAGVEGIPPARAAAALTAVGAVIPRTRMAAVADTTTK